MKKLVAYLLLAGTVYVLIYVALLGYLRFKASDVRDFCDALQVGSTLQAAQRNAEQNGLTVTLSQTDKVNTQIVYFTAPQHTDAGCEGLVQNGNIKQKKFQLSLF